MPNPEFLHSVNCLAKRMREAKSFDELDLLIRQIEEMARSLGLPVPLVVEREILFGDEKPPESGVFCGIFTEAVVYDSALKTTERHEVDAIRFWHNAYRESDPAVIAGKRGDSNFQRARRESIYRAAYLAEIEGDQRVTHDKGMSLEHMDARNLIANRLEEYVNYYSVASEGTQRKEPADQRKRGPKQKHPPSDDARLVRAWKASGLTMADYALKHSTDQDPLTAKKIREANDRHRKREQRKG